MRSRRIRPMLVIVATAALALAACGDSDDTVATDDGVQGAQSSGERPPANACPDDGCIIRIVDAQRSTAGEIQLTWEGNFDPDVSKNHIHVYWDRFTAQEVSSDAADNGVEQGVWVPTGDYPGFLTVDSVSIAERGDSTTLCVTAADRDHAVIDPTAVDCRDVADLL